MKKIARLLVFAVSTSLITGLFSGCGLISKTPEGEANTVVAVVNDQKLTKGEFDKKFASQEAYYSIYYGQDFFTNPQNKEAVKQMKDDMLQNLTDEMFALQKADELKLVPDKSALDAEINKTLQDEITQAGGQDQFDQNLAKVKMTADDIKDEISNQIIIQKLHDYIVKDVTVSNDEMNKYYQENLYDYSIKPNVMNLSHIQVNTQDEALKIKDELNTGAKFEDLAKKYSTDTDTKNNGGLLGDITYDNTQVDQTFLEYAKLVPEGKVSEPVQTQYGWQLIKVNKRTLYPAKPFSEVKNDIKEKLLEQKQTDKYNQTMQGWKGKAKIKLYTDRL